jgi:hypothetical protein
MTDGLANYYRFFIATVPIEVLMIGGLAAAIASPRDHGTPQFAESTLRSADRRRWRNIAASALALSTMILGTVTTTTGMFDPNIGVQETQLLAFIFETHLNSTEKSLEGRHAQILQYSSYFQSLKLPDGDIIVDNSTECVPEILVTINQPKLFVIPNDRDFQRELADPLTFHAHYILDPNPAQITVSAQNIEYPSLFATGGGFAQLVHQFPGQGWCPEFRLYKVVAHPNAVQ